VQRLTSITMSGANGAPAQSSSGGARDYTPQHVVNQLISPAPCKFVTRINVCGSKQIVNAFLPADALLTTSSAQPAAPGTMSLSTRSSASLLGWGWLGHLPHRWRAGLLRGGPAPVALDGRGGLGARLGAGRGRFLALGGHQRLGRHALWGKGVGAQGGLFVSTNQDHSVAGGCICINLAQQ
jgi:hypothetical protein